jgi:elongation factor G
MDSGAIVDRDMGGLTGTTLLSLGIRAKTKADQERLRHGLGTLMVEDPTISAKTDQATGEVVIGGTGEVHLQIVIDRLRREFNVEASVSPPKVAYKETLTRPAKGEMKYASQTGGRGQYAHAKIRLYPGEPGSGYVFENSVVDGAIPKQFVEPINEGIKETLTHGVLAGYPVDDVRVVLYDGSYHQADSSDVAFRIAGSMAFNDAARKAEPVLLEPVVQVEVVVPAEHRDDIMSNLASRRGQIQSHEDRDRFSIISARVPVSEMLGYAADLRSRTQGRGTFAMLFAFFQRFDPPENKIGGDDSMVGAPRKPRPAVPGSSVALPEPAEDDLGD